MPQNTVKMGIQKITGGGSTSSKICNDAFIFYTVFELYGIVFFHQSGIEYMKATQIPFQKTGFFSKITDCESRKDVEELYHHYPDFDGFAKNLQEKKRRFQRVTGRSFLKTLW